MEFLKDILFLLWPPHYYRFVKDLFKPYSGGWGGAVESLVFPFMVMLALTVPAIWVVVLVGVYAIAQHVSFH